MKTKKRVTRCRVAMAAASDIPDGGLGQDSACGHGGCGASCKVRYVGPTSSIRDHHILHAARGMTHVWSAAIISGLAIVVTGAFAYSSVQARETAAPRVTRPSPEYQNILARMEKMEETLAQVQTACAKALEPAPAVTDENNPDDQSAN